MEHNAEYLLSLLRDGASVDDLAKQITDALNEASVAYQAEQKAKREAEEKAKLAAEEASKRDEKREYMASEITRTIREYVEEFYPDLAGEIAGAEFTDTFIKSMDEMAKLARNLKELENTLGEDWLEEFRNLW